MLCVYDSPATAPPRESAFGILQKKRPWHRDKGSEARKTGSPTNANPLPPACFCEKIRNIARVRVLGAFYHRGGREEGREEGRSKGHSRKDRSTTKQSRTAYVIQVPRFARAPHLPSASTLPSSLPARPHLPFPPPSPLPWIRVDGRCDQVSFVRYIISCV